MSEALVSAVMQQLVSILTQQAQEGIKLIVGADEEVRNLKSNFLAIQGVLEDAEGKQVKQKAVRDWLEKLKDVSYDIDDVLDEWNTAIQKLRIQEIENASKPLRKVCSLFPCYGFCVRRVVVRYDIAVKIKNLNTRLDVIAIEKDRFNFRITKGIEGALERQITTSDIDVSEVRGRDEEKDTLLNLLMSESSQGPPIPIISIVGMGGIGKTTLARLAYNDYKVNAHFDEKIWVCVSDPFDQIRIAKEILESLRNEAPNLNALETVMRNIRQSIQGKTFLLVLDDVWTEDPKDWEPLKHSLMRGCPGSRILVTTRREDVANVIGTTHIIRIGTLPGNQCWSMFSQLAFSGRTTEECEELKDIGKKLVRRCKGLPLAVKTLGSLLRFKREIKEWQSVLDSEIWEVEELERGLFPPLLLSYYDLPSILKKCFSYCAIFPKDYKIYREELIRLWMAQDYLKAKPSRDEELVGEDYFKILAMRSFFQDFEKDDSKIISSKMHDIVHDFAQFLTKNECFALEVDDSEKSLLEFYEKVRHLMIIAKKKASFPISVYTVKNLRSLVVEDGMNFRDYMNLSNIFDRLTCLRTLELSRISIEQIPRGIENFIHLRYLKLYGNENIKQLPEKLCELYNLQHLDVRCCGRLQKLPQGIGKLINLRYLYCYESPISYMPKGVERLTCLERLHDFVVSESDGGRKACKLGCLKNLNHLKSLVIKGLGNLADLGELQTAQINSKRNLVDLRLNFEGTMNMDHEAVVEAVQPPPNLVQLIINNYRGKTLFPNWLTQVRNLSFERWSNCEHLPPLGKLPSLESLFIYRLKSIRRVGNEFLGIESDIATSSPSSSSSPSIIAFPKLKSLGFSDMDEWEEWEYGITETTGISEQHNHVTIMPCLRTLRLYDCPKLKSMPSHLLPVTKSNNFKCYDCPLLNEYLDHEKNGEREGR